MSGIRYGLNEVSALNLTINFSLICFSLFLTRDFVIPHLFAFLMSLLLTRMLAT